MNKLFEKFKSKWVKKNLFQCPYYKRSQLKDRTVGVAGFCELQSQQIYYERAVGKIHYSVCEGLDRRNFYDCAVYLIIGEEIRQNEK